MGQDLFHWILKNIIKLYSNKDIVVLAEKQAKR